MDKKSAGYKVLIVGPYPGKIGGVSTFVKRLHRASIPGIKTYVLNTQNFTLPRENVFSLAYSFWLIYKADLIHINVSRLPVILLFSLLAFIFHKKNIVQIHSLRYKINKIKNIELKLILNLSDVIIVVNKDIQSTLSQKFPSSKHKIFIVPPFIKPRDYCSDPLPKEILNLRKNASNLIVANAFKIVYCNESDLYGLGLSIDMFNRLVLRFPKTAFVFIVSVSTKEMAEIVSKHKVHNNFLLYDKPVNFISLLKISDLFVRPTFSDGDSLSVREALSLGVPTIASSVVERPDSVILFDINSPLDFFNKVAEVLKDINYYNEIFTKIASKQEDYLKDIKNIYFRVLKRKFFLHRKEHKHETDI